MAFNFEVITDCIPHSSLSPEEFEEFDTYFAGCSCNPIALCDECPGCSCRQHTPLAYNVNGRLKPEYLQSTSILPPVMECGSTCECGDDCLSRVVGQSRQRSLSHLETFPVGQKGTGLRSTVLIPAMSFVCEYVGEVISVEEAARRSQENQEDTYIFTAQEHFGSTVVKTCVDARKRGGLARFINHSCEPNLVIVPVRVDISIPKLCLFAQRDVFAGEELTVDYGSHGLDSLLLEGVQGGSNKLCACASLNCKGFLPFEQNLFDSSPQ